MSTLPAAPPPMSPLPPAAPSSSSSSPPTPPPAVEMKMPLFYIGSASIAVGVLSLLLVVWNHAILKSKGRRDPKYTAKRQDRIVNQAAPFRSATRARGSRIRSPGIVEPPAYCSPRSRPGWMVQPFAPYFLSDDAVVQQIRHEAQKDGSGQPVARALVSHEQAMKHFQTIRKVFSSAILAERLSHSVSSASVTSSWAASDSLRGSDKSHCSKASSADPATMDELEA